MVILHKISSMHVMNVCAAVFLILFNLLVNYLSCTSIMVIKIKNTTVDLI